MGARSTASKRSWLGVASVAFVLLGSGCSVPGVDGTGRTGGAPGGGDRDRDRDRVRADHGVAVTVDDRGGAAVWSRTDRASRMHVELRREGRPQESQVLRAEVDLRADADFAGVARFGGDQTLSPSSLYRYSVSFDSAPPSEDGSPPRGEPQAFLTGSFRTPPRREFPEPLRLVWSGDLAGQNVCRDAERGFPIFEALVQERADVFVGLGDMIYADGTCSAMGLYGNPQVPGAFAPAEDIESFWAHWRYTREDPGLKSLLSQTAYVAVWDDHEVIDDFGPAHDTRPREGTMGGEATGATPSPHLLPLGLQAFVDYNPMPADENGRLGRAEGGAAVRLYRRLRWGKHLELFVLDTRQHRDANRDHDDGPRPKSLLGDAQRSWLLHGLADSDATWKVVVSSVPIGVPTGMGAGAAGRDGWSTHGTETGFERELTRIFEFLRAREIHNTLWITTDVQFAQVLRYRPFHYAPDFRIHEVMVGPLNAGVLANPTLDATFSPERLFLFGPENPQGIGSFSEAAEWFSYGALDIDARGRLELRVANLRGEELYSLALRPRPARWPFHPIAHRGASAYAPENTMPAFEKALELGAREVELDVQLSRDGDVVLYHDSTLPKKTGVEGVVSDYTTAELRRFDIGSWFDAEHPEVEEAFAGTGLITLAELFSRFGSKLYYHVEIKSTEPELSGLVLKEIERAGLADRVMVTSFRFEQLERMRALDDAIPLSLLVGDEEDLRVFYPDAGPAVPLFDLQLRELERSADAGLDQIGLPLPELSPELIAEAHARGLEIRAWRVKSLESMEKALDLGCDGMTIDWPDLLLQAKAERDARERN